MAILALGNEWYVHDTSQAQRPFAIATDASLDKLGYVSFTRVDAAWKVHRQGFLILEHTTTIDVEEARAVIFTLLELKDFLQDYRPDAIVIGIDNLGISRSLLRGTSASTGANPLVQETIDFLIERVNPQKLGFCDIASEDNVADVLTRHGDCESYDYNTRLELTKTALNRALDNLNQNLRWTPRLRAPALEPVPTVGTFAL